MTTESYSHNHAEEDMASGDTKDPVYGQPYVGTPTSGAVTTPRTQTVLNMYKLRRETVTIQANDHDYVQTGPSAGDAYHE